MDDIHLSAFRISDRLVQQDQAVPADLLQRNPDVGQEGNVFTDQGGGNENGNMIFHGYKIADGMDIFIYLLNIYSTSVSRHKGL